MHLPFINQFTNPYQIWDTRPATESEIHDRRTNSCNFFELNKPVKTHLIDEINTPLKAVTYILNRQYTTEIDNFTTSSINNKLSNHADSRRMMPSKTPIVLSNYQRNYNSRTNKIDMDEVNNSILAHGKFLSDNQVLFHGGGILNQTPEGSSFTTDRPLSTSLCPHKAYLNGEFNSKYYHQNEVNIIILTVEKISQPAFVFKINGTNKGHEKEVLVAAGATIKVISKTLINNSHTVICYDENAGRAVQKSVPAYLVNATIS